MSDLDQLRIDLIASWGDRPAGGLSVRLFDRLASTPVEELAMLTYPTLAKILERSRVDHELVVAVGMLVTSSVHALEARAMFIDDDDQEYELSARDVAQAARTGHLEHPGSGDVIADFDDKIMPFFVPSHRFLQALCAARR